MPGRIVRCARVHRQVLLTGVFCSATPVRGGGEGHHLVAVGQRHVGDIDLRSGMKAGAVDVSLRHRVAGGENNVAGADVQRRHSRREMGQRIRHHDVGQRHIAGIADVDGVIDHVAGVGLAVMIGVGDRAYRLHDRQAGLVNQRCIRRGAVRQCFVARRSRRVGQLVIGGSIRCDGVDAVAVHVRLRDRIGGRDIFVAVSAGADCQRHAGADDAARQRIVDRYVGQRHVAGVGDVHVVGDHIAGIAGDAVIVGVGFRHERLQDRQVRLVGQRRIRRRALRQGFVAGGRRGVGQLVISGGIGCEGVDAVAVHVRLCDHVGRRQVFAAAEIQRDAGADDAAGQRVRYGHVMQRHAARVGDMHVIGNHVAGIAEDAVTVGVGFRRERLQDRQVGRIGDDDNRSVNAGVFIDDMLAGGKRDGYGLARSINEAIGQCGAGADGGEVIANGGAEDDLVAAGEEVGEVVGPGAVGGGGLHHGVGYGIDQHDDLAGDAGLTGLERAIGAGTAAVDELNAGDGAEFTRCLRCKFLIENAETDPCIGWSARIQIRIHVNGHVEVLVARIQRQIRE